MKIEDKRAFLLGEETLKIVVALICIVFLIYFLAMIYFAKINEKKLQEAESILKSSSPGSVKTIIERVENGKGNLGGNSEELPIPNPVGWYLFAFVNIEKPNSCAGENCLCICDKLASWNFWKAQIEECDKDGTCLIAGNLKSFNPIEIEINTALIVTKQSNGLSIKRK